eukprot:TRINITY_DN62749_c0_g1_i1.p2 TRINITY_DN62749_c0_g1~~TRINITY_DN62749_c0_g1_i1.p2  ORF type:complete len:583 (+),score=77.54 TRINITY_DN62749_c0_g1_i1:28-1776(+)
MLNLTRVLAFLAVYCWVTNGYALWPIPAAQRTTGTWIKKTGYTYASHQCDVTTGKDDGTCENQCENIPNCVGYVADHGTCYFKDCNGTLSPKAGFTSAIFHPNVFMVDSTSFTWDCTTSGTLQRACQRYKSFIFPKKNGPQKIRPDQAATAVNKLEMQVKNIAAKLELGMDESYTLDINSPTITIKANTTFGGLRALETLSQLILGGPNYYTIQTIVSDAPRFQFRGVMIDTARHYLPVEAILANIDAMAYNKFNVLHWHIVDDQSFPYVSTKYPLLNQKGSYTPTDIYTPAVIKQVIEYAADRGIWVMPEFDTPAHSRSWGNGYPWLLTNCDGDLYAMYPIADSVYDFMKNFWAEVKTVFNRSPYFHLGGDEVSFGCWEKNATITAWMKAKGWTQYNKLESYYVQHIVDTVKNLDIGVLTWQEVFDNNVTLPKTAIVDVWKSGTKHVAKVTAAGYRTIWSQPWYLNYIRYGNVWEGYYKADPTDFDGTPAQKKLVIGGEVCMWAEYVDATNVVSRIWANAAAPGERLWSEKRYSTYEDGARARIEHQRCRMIARGIEAEPTSGPSHCAHPYTFHYTPPWAQ